MCWLTTLDSLPSFPQELRIGPALSSGRRGRRRGVVLVVAVAAVEAQGVNLYCFNSF